MYKLHAIRYLAFYEAYAKHLAKDMSDNPDSYNHEHAELLESKMKTIRFGDYDTDTALIRKTCADLGIENTLRAISVYIYCE